MRNLNAEIDLRREQESLISAKARLYSMSDTEFREYWVRVGQYFRTFSAYISHLTSDELHQFNMLGPVSPLPQGMGENVVFPRTGRIPSAGAVGEIPDTPTNESLEEPLEVR